MVDFAYWWSFSGEWSVSVSETFDWVVSNFFFNKNSLVLGKVEFKPFTQLASWLVESVSRNVHVSVCLLVPP